MSRLAPGRALRFALALALLAAGRAEAQSVAYQPFDVERLDDILRGAAPRP